MPSRISSSEGLAKQSRSRLRLYAASVDHSGPGLIEMLCERLRATDQQMAEVALLGLPVRLAKTLLRMAAVERPAANGRAAPLIRLSQRELGNLVGATRESVNKCLRDWQRKGIVRIAESAITIANQTALRNLAELERG